MAFPHTQTLTTFLTARHLPPSTAWLDTCLSSIRPTTPLPALQQTVLFRLLVSDLTTSLASTAASLPTNIPSATAKEARLPTSVVFQVLDMEDVGSSRWSQVEAIDARERGESTRGREVIRVVPVVGENGVAETSAPSASSGPHKLLLQDVRGGKIYAFENSRIEGFAIGSLGIGGKVLVKAGAIVARGVLMLNAKDVEVLGGRVEAWDEAWGEKRREVLRERVGAAEEH